ncbi:MAG: hypothetical protein Q9M45_05620 [Robiginitomaculum sp.]|nr:hypothetical protein [Robiginitomaculum sp.]
MDPTNPSSNTDAINNAGDALQALADGPARQAADAIGESFARGRAAHFL